MSAQPHEHPVLLRVLRPYEVSVPVSLVCCELMPVSFVIVSLFTPQTLQLCVKPVKRCMEITEPGLKAPNCQVKQAEAVPLAALTTRRTMWSIAAPFRTISAQQNLQGHFEFP